MVGSENTLTFSYLYANTNSINMSTENIIIEALVKEGKPLKAGEIAEITNIDKKEIDKGIKNLKTEEKIFSPKRCYYAPK